MVDFITYCITVFFPALADNFIDFLIAPLRYPEMIWILIPLFGTVILMELYFGRYPREDIGYHAALENTMYLLFVSVDLIRYLIVNNQIMNTIKVYFIVFIVIYAFIMSILDFYHKLPRHVAFKTSSKSILGFTAYIAIIVVYSDILLNLNNLSTATTLASIFLLFFVYRLFMIFVHFMQPPEHDKVETLLKKVESELHQAAKESKKK